MRKTEKLLIELAAARLERDEAVAGMQRSKQRLKECQETLRALADPWHTQRRRPEDDVVEIEDLFPPRVE